MTDSKLDLALNSLDLSLAELISTGVCLTASIYVNARCQNSEFGLTSRRDFLLWHDTEWKHQQETEKS